MFSSLPQLREYVRIVTDFFANAKRDREAAPFPIAQVSYNVKQNRLGGRTPLRVTSMDRGWNEKQWSDFIRKGETNDQKLRELPLVGQPGVMLLRGLELLLDEDVDMFDNRLEDFDRLKDTTIADDYELGHYFFTSEKKQHISGKRAPRYHLIVPEATICYNQQLYLIGDDDYKEVEKYLRQIGAENARNLLFYDCFDPTTAKKLKPWGDRIISESIKPGVKGINRKSADLKTQMFMMSGQREWMENALVSTLRLDHYLYCRTYEGWREVASPTERKIRHSLCDTELFPPTVRKVCSPAVIQIRMKLSLLCCNPPFATDACDCANRKIRQTSLYLTTRGKWMD